MFPCMSQIISYPILYYPHIISYHILYYTHIISYPILYYPINMGTKLNELHYFYQIGSNFYFDEKFLSQKI